MCRRNLQVVMFPRKITDGGGTGTGGFAFRALLVSPFGWPGEGVRHLQGAGGSGRAKNRPRHMRTTEPAKLLQRVSAALPALYLHLRERRQEISCVKPRPARTPHTYPQHKLRGSTVFICKHRLHDCSFIFVYRLSLYSASMHVSVNLNAKSININNYLKILPGILGRENGFLYKTFLKSVHI